MSNTNAAKKEKNETKERAIHPATVKKAANSGVSFEKTRSGGYRATHAASGKTSLGSSPKDALETLLKKIDISEDSEDGEEEGEGSGKVIVKEKYKKIYLPNGGNCGDKLAKALTSFRPSANSFEKVCRENKVAPGRWEGVKNAGLKWMALSNILRHRIIRKEEVTVNGEKVTSLK